MCDETHFQDKLEDKVQELSGKLKFYRQLIFVPKVFIDFEATFALNAAQCEKETDLLLIKFSLNNQQLEWLSEWSVCGIGSNMITSRLKESRLH